MILCAGFPDRVRDRGLWTQVGWALEIAAFAIWLGVPSSAHKARFAALVLAEVGHYVCTPLIVTWQANNSGNKSRRAVAVPGAVSLAQAVAVGSGYLFPSTDSPKYSMGSAVILALSCAGAGFTGFYQFMIWRENRKRDEREGGPPAIDFRPDTATYADDAPGFRYMK
ncbi:hypothetical protein L486_06115 [Kwoniella mangroviensis CBS 10435]|uniref:Uncharacterized protein n=2 Tax=Kwoniella mangrovensis TaxID=463800 RepID=A0A1B9ILD1_9TREE|nr:hypothetical protein L486_06115 [Kwoniella mangroviensis CBS 10435]OCF78924.1 hypothetical protein I204_00868 [Kwoniella mangroviensis CBS 8886]